MLPQYHLTEYSHPSREALLSSPFYRWESRDSGLLTRGRARTRRTNAEPEPCSEQRQGDGASPTLTILLSGAPAVEGGVARGEVQRFPVRLGALLGHELQLGLLTGLAGRRQKTGTGGALGCSGQGT